MLLLSSPKKGAARRSGNRGVISQKGRRAVWMRPLRIPMYISASEKSPVHECCRHRLPRGLESSAGAAANITVDFDGALTLEDWFLELEAPVNSPRRVNPVGCYKRVQVRLSEPHAPPYLDGRYEALCP